MKRSITLLLLLALFSGMLTGCDSRDAKYRPDGDEYKWICEEIDMWFLCVYQPIDSSYSNYYNSSFIGELTLDGETTPIIILFSRFNGVNVDKFFGFDDVVWSVDRGLFGGKGQFYEGWFTLKVREEYIDYVGFEELTFRRVELTEEDLAWIEAADSIDPTSPSQTPPIATEAPVNSAEPTPDAPPTVTYPVPDFLEGTVSIQRFLEGEDIAYLCQSAVICGAVTNSGRLLLWSDYHSDISEEYRTDSLEPIYIVDLQNITAAWLTNNENLYTNFALDRDGRLWGFSGWNARGIIPGYGVEKIAPVVVMEHIVSFAMGSALSTTWAAAVTEQNEVLVWGWLGGDELVLPTVIATDAVSVIESNECLYIVTTNGDLVDLGWGGNLLKGNVVRTFVKENAVWGCGNYVLGADGVLYYRENDKAWTVVAEDVKMANCTESIAFYLTNTGELYAWKNEGYGWFPNLHLPDSPTGETYIKLLDDVALAAPAELGTGITALLDDGTMLRITVEPHSQTSPSD